MLRHGRIAKNLTRALHPGEIIKKGLASKGLRISTLGLLSAPRVSGAINKRFRLEIEGLRAVAVIAVLLFHSGFGIISGGFLGVDIFFVISGFLITRNIIAEAEADGFRLSRFYWRRILRLFPASATTIFVTLLAGFVLLPPDEVMQLTHSAIAAIFAVSNVSPFRLLPVCLLSDDQGCSGSS